ncbi:hypothetical protein BDV41DRAFT_529770 [Aspergillus transmontanensis]|uniref:Uncharacterized protein n=1 Tax=Aspergillus transmontanensis TaxID=1034304 RepID=A0A5N6W5D8_9EURO|nr:hypothetical protein BDV41DRAFT_529770 [Aspergillus transmontanensis]
MTDIIGFPCCLLFAIALMSGNFEETKGRKGKSNKKWGREGGGVQSSNVQLVIYAILD